MPDPHQLRSVAAQRVATITRIAAGFGNEQIAPVVGPVFPAVIEALAAVGAHPAGPAVALYRADSSGGVRVTAGFVVPDDLSAAPGVDVHDLPAVPEAAVAVHRGETSGIGAAWEALMAAIGKDGWVPSDAGREVSLTPGDRPQAEWITELVQPITRPAAG